VGLLDVLRGQRTPKRADLDRLFGIGSAAVTLEAGMGLRPTGRAGVCFKPVEAGVFDELMREIEELLAATSSDSGTAISRHDDEFGFSWIVISDPDVEDLATTTHVVSQSLEERGFSERLLCAVFGFDGPPGAVSLVYAYKRGAFYPFAPREGKVRDTTLELRLQGVLGDELPIEPELERWYPVWNAPVSPG
jgi:PspAB-like protein